VAIGTFAVMEIASVHAEHMAALAANDPNILVVIVARGRRFNEQL
jgi:hypothetical protein